MRCVTLRALAAQVILLTLPTHFARAQSTTTITTTSTTIIQTQFVFVTSASGVATTVTTETSVAGITIGTTVVAGSSTLETNVPAATSSPGGSDMDWSPTNTFQSAVLNSTNYFRAQHQASALSWNSSLASFASNHAQNCVFEHSGGPYGENLAEGYPSVAVSIDAWADEESKYNYGKEHFTEKAGHFTQLVWKDTTTVGCGAVKCNNDASSGVNGWYLICEYWPRGNVKGEFGTNVHKAGESKTGKPGLGGAGRTGNGGGAGGLALVALAVAGAMTVALL